MKDTTTRRGALLVTAVAAAATASALTTLGKFVRREIRRRGYPSWEDCRCDFKHNETIFQVWYSRHERRGETIMAHEWGAYLTHPAPWLRRFLHYSSQVLATLNPRNRYLERVTLSPQEAYQFARLLRSSSSDDTDKKLDLPSAQIVWRREILHLPGYPFGLCIRRLYPAHISRERTAEAQPIPVLWDPRRDLPLPTEGPLLETPVGTRIDYIGWTPSQISYCTARLHARS
jgi:hypothetical protein